VTAADGAPEFYSLSNEARYENIEQAIEVDKKLRNAYIGHHKLFIIDNTSNTDFKMKIDKCIGIVTKMIGLPTPSAFFKKFLIDIPDKDDHSKMRIPESILSETVSIEESILEVPDNFKNKEDIEIYARKRGKEG
jgi:hypothetical protein